MAQAKNLREELGLDQLSALGDIEELVSEMGHKIVYDDFGDDFSATCITADGINFTIALNKNHMWNENFKRFTIAHELAHISLIEHHFEMQRRGGKLMSNAEFQSNEPIEREADRFAVYFLAPKPLFEQHIKGKEFDKKTLKDICNELGISLLTGAFRFIELTDLCCSLIAIDESSQKIKYEFRSKLMKEFNKHEYLKGWYSPYQGNLSKVLGKPITYQIEDENIELNVYYQDLKISLRCKESVIRLGYNNTTIALLSAIEDPDDYVE